MITIITTKRYLESSSRQGRAPSPDLELAPRCRPWSCPMMRTAGWSTYLGWMGSSTQMGSDSPINGAVSIKRSLDLLIVALMRRSSSVDDLAARTSSGLDLLWCWHRFRRRRRGPCRVDRNSGLMATKATCRWNMTVATWCAGPVTLIGRRRWICWVKSMTTPLFWRDKP
jgi:hypothetical protein